ncbi:MAG: protein kinase [Kofleriaceae bacterium]
MSRCPQCKTDYPEHVLVCAVDGEVLTGELRQVRSPAGFDDTVSMKAVVAVSDTVSLAQSAAAVQPSAKPANKDLLPAGFRVGEYEVTSHIGSGGMATVYAGVQPVIGKKVAIKVLSRMLSADTTMVDRFVQEARAVNQIRHHNIVDIFALGELPDGRAYCVMELLVGETLKDRMRHGSPTYEETFAILSQVCEGLDAAHRANVVHRDLKPDNIFLVESQRGPVVKILDFGIAKLLDSEADPSQRTRAGILMGTPEYMSPEQCSGRDVDARADLYLLGVMMFEVFTGHLPFTAATPIMTINAHVSERPTDPRQYVDLPAQLCDLILGCLAKEPAERPQTALEVRDRLAEVVEALGVDVAAVLALPRTTGGMQVPRTRSGVTNPRNELRSRSRVPKLIGAVLVLALAGVGLFVVIKSFGKQGATSAIDAGAAAVGIDAPPPPVEVPMLALQVISDPPGATVTIDGRPQALRSPYVYKIPWASEVAIRVELAGFLPLDRKVALAKGELEKAIDAKLTPVDAGAGSATVAVRPDKAPKGMPSVISDLHVTPDVAYIGEKTTITGVIKFEDRDGDVSMIRVETRGGRAQSTPLRVAGAKSGTAAFTLVMTPSNAGTQTVEVWVQDAGDNTSNKLTAPVEAAARPKPEPSDKPEPDKPEPDRPDPDKPDPDKPEPGDKPEPDKPGDKAEGDKPKATDKPAESTVPRPADKPIVKPKAGKPAPKSTKLQKPADKPRAGSAEPPAEN